MRDYIMVVYGQKAEAWSLKYGIEPMEHPCNACGKTLKTTIPFAYGEYRGLIAQTCACGDTDTPYCFVRDPRKGDLFDPSILKGEG